MSTHNSLWGIRNDTHSLEHAHSYGVYCAQWLASSAGQAGKGAGNMIKLFLYSVSLHFLMVSKGLYPLMSKEANTNEKLRYSGSCLLSRQEGQQDGEREAEDQQPAAQRMLRTVRASLCSSDINRSPRTAMRCLKLMGCRSWKPRTLIIGHQRKIWP